MKNVLVAAIIFLTCSSIVSSKSHREEKSLLKALLSSLKDPELNKERVFAEALLAKESTANSLSLLGSDYQSLDLNSASSSSTREGRGGRSKRSIGFLTRLGACVMTFFSNPTCWTRLTRAQIQREQNRQLELQQQEEQRRYLEQKIYQGYLNTLLGQPSSSSSSSTNGTNSDGSSSSGTINGTTTTTVIDGNSLSPSSITLPLLNLSTMSMLTPTTTRRPLLFPMSHRLISRVFPRLYNFMSQAMNPQPTYFTGSSSSISSNQPQYTRNFF